MPTGHEDRDDPYAAFRCTRPGCSHLDVYHVNKTGKCWAGLHVDQDCGCTQFTPPTTGDAK